jgi:hypothetical protein
MVVLLGIIGGIYGTIDDLPFDKHLTTGSFMRIADLNGAVGGRFP